MEFYRLFFGCTLTEAQGALRHRLEAIPAHDVKRPHLVPAHLLQNRTGAAIDPLAELGPSVERLRRGDD